MSSSEQDEGDEGDEEDEEVEEAGGERRLLTTNSKVTIPAMRYLYNDNPIDCLTCNSLS